MASWGDGDSWYLDPRRCGGGALADNGPNAFDLLRMFIGELSVTNAIIERNDHGVDTRASIDVTATGTGTRGSILLDWGYTGGELKDVTIERDDGEELSCDMLKGFGLFKESLYHEYEGVLTDFLDCVQRRDTSRAAGPDGIEVTRLVQDSYRLAKPVSRINLAP